MSGGGFRLGQVDSADKNHFVLSPSPSKLRDGQKEYREPFGPLYGEENNTVYVTSNPTLHINRQQDQTSSGELSIDVEIFSNLTQKEVEELTISGRAESDSSFKIKYNLSCIEPFSYPIDLEKNWYETLLKDNIKSSGQSEKMKYIYEQRLTQHSGATNSRNAFEMAIGRAESESIPSDKIESCKQTVEAEYPLPTKLEDIQDVDEAFAQYNDMGVEFTKCIDENIGEFRWIHSEKEEDLKEDQYTQRVVNSCYWENMYGTLENYRTCKNKRSADEAQSRLERNGRPFIKMAIASGVTPQTAENCFSPLNEDERNRYYYYESYFNKRLNCLAEAMLDAKK